MKLKGYSFSLGSILLMSVAGPLQKMASSLGGPMQALMLSTAFAMLASFTVSVLKRKKLTWPSKAELTLSALYTLAMLAFVWALTLENPLVVSFFARTYIVFGFVFSFFILKERPSRIQKIAMVFITAGSFLLGYKNFDGQLHLLGAMLALLYALFFAVHNSYLKISYQKSTEGILFWQNLLCASVCLIFCTLRQSPFVLEPPFVGIAAVCGIVSSFLGIVLHQWSLHILTLGEATSLRALSPVVAILVVLPFYPPDWNPLMISGMSIIFAGGLIYNLEGYFYAKTPYRRILPLFKRKNAPEERAESDFKATL